MQSLVSARSPGKVKHPFARPRRLSPDLARVEAYWRGLLRGEAEMPFADDVNPSAFADLADRVLLIEVFDLPERFRFARVGKALAGDVEGKFLDETALTGPFDFLRAQASATVEAAEPTCFQHEAPIGGYQRLLLPAWGEGRISLILGVVAFD